MRNLRPSQPDEWHVDILADSISNWGDRLTTFDVRMPRMVLADITRHRAASFSVESTRAIPTEVRIEQLETDPFIPHFQKRAPGMGGGELLQGEELEQAIISWLEARDAVVKYAKANLHLDKQRVARALEPWAWVTFIISATEWGNLFALRAPEGDVVDINFPAQPELQQAVIKMRSQHRESDPARLVDGQWHLPTITLDDWAEAGYVASQNAFATDPLYERAVRILKKVSAGRIARWSSYGKRTPETFLKSTERCNMLAGSAHWSPLEHPATPDYLGALSNFSGWKQYRKEFAYEHDHSEWKEKHEPSTI